MTKAEDSMAPGGRAAAAPREQHTPGPWQLAGPESGTKWNVYDADWRDVALAQQRVGGGVPDHERTANAALIAAAPDLLAALRSLESVATETHASAMRPQWNVIERLGRAIDAARTALAKARATEAKPTPSSNEPRGGAPRDGGGTA